MERATGCGAEAALQRSVNGDMGDMEMRSHREGTPGKATATPARAKRVREGRGGESTEEEWDLLTVQRDRRAARERWRIVRELGGMQSSRKRGRGSAVKRAIQRESKRVNGGGTCSESEEGHPAPSEKGVMGQACQRTECNMERMECEELRVKLAELSDKAAGMLMAVKQEIEEVRVAEREAHQKRLEAEKMLQAMEDRNRLERIGLGCREKDGDGAEPGLSARRLQELQQKLKDEKKAVGVIQERVLRLMEKEEQLLQELRVELVQDMQAEIHWLESSRAASERQHVRQKAEVERQQAELRQLQKEFKGEKELLRMEGGGGPWNRKRVVLGIQELIGVTEQVELERVAALDTEMRRVEMKGLKGAILYNYKSGERLKGVVDRLCAKKEGKENLFRLLAECRGLVLCNGLVVARPVQRFRRVAEMCSLAESVTTELVTEKLDGVMVCGVVMAGAVEMWSRGGWTEHAQAATRVARETHGMLELITLIWELGGSATFEFIGKQNAIKVRYGCTELVLVAVRDMETGRWWEYERLEHMCRRYGARFVARYKELEGKTLKEIVEVVEHWQDREGVVARLKGGDMCKVKSIWWLERACRQGKRWYREEADKVQADRRLAKRKLNMESRHQRVVLRGWDSTVNPAKALQYFKEAGKVEAIYGRASGKQGTLVLGFRGEDAAQAVRGRHMIGGRVVWAERAYSDRSRSNMWRVVRAWWRQHGEEGEESDVRRDEEEGWAESDEGVCGECGYGVMVCDCESMSVYE